MGYRIAGDFLFPHLKVDEPPVVADPPPEEPAKAPGFWTSDEAVAIIVFGIVLGFFGLVVALLVLVRAI